jgi:hypothetical protein
MNSQLDGFNELYPLHTAAALVIPRAQPGDLLINDVPDNRPEPNKFNDSNRYYFESANFTSIVSRGSETFEKNRDVITASTRVWLAYENERRPSNLDALRQELGTLFQPCFDLDGANDLRVELYVRLSDTCPGDGV